MILAMPLMKKNETPPKEFDINQILADNFLRVLAGRSPETWKKQANPVWVSGPKKGKPLSQRLLRNILNRFNSPSLDVVASIAAAAHLLPYQLLFPQLDPSDAPILMSAAQQQLIDSITQTASLLRQERPK